MITDTVQSSALFVTSAAQAGQAENIAKRALAQGLSLFDSQDYEGAIQQFQRAVGWAPTSANSVTAYSLMAQSYIKLNDSAGAIEAYRKAIRIDPNNAELRIALGNLYHFEKRYAEAVSEYAEAVRADPGATSRYSLAQGYLSNGQYEEAKSQFLQVKALTPNQPYGDYGLGLVYAKQGRYEEALAAFDRALAIKPDHLDAYSEKGFVYADMGRLEEAQTISSDLKEKDASLAALLDLYIYNKTPPKMIAADSQNFFPEQYGPKTPVVVLSSDLALPDSSKTFSMDFYFSKPMDPESVENVLNWSIGRSIGRGPGTAYNFGLKIADTELRLSPHPLAVTYDADKLVARVLFRIQQNSTANGTLDLGHIQFSFKGQDLNGLAISGQADQYTGFSGFA